jgi:spore maturation protein B
MKEIVTSISTWAVPIILVTIPIVGLARGVKVYEVFVEGAKEGFDVAVRIIPFLVAILVAIGMFRGSGAMDLLTEAVSPALNLVGFPPDLLPLAVVRSMSGSGSLALMTDAATIHGGDSLVGRMAATMYGSTETTFYVLAVYFGAIGIRKTRHAIPAALIADAVAMVAAVLVCRWMFG